MTHFFGSEASAGIEPAIKVLQTSALPLGDDAVTKNADWA